MSNGPLSLYRSRRGTGTLKADAAQEYAAERLQSLFQALREYKPIMGKVGWRARFGLTRRPDPAPMTAQDQGLARSVGAPHPRRLVIG